MHFQLIQGRFLNGIMCICEFSLIVNVYEYEVGHILANQIKATGYFHDNQEEEIFSSWPMYLLRIDWQSTPSYTINWSVNRRVHGVVYLVTVQKNRKRGVHPSTRVKKVKNHLERYCGEATYATRPHYSLRKKFCTTILWCV